jgi:hypothetical protein
MIITLTEEITVEQLWEAVWGCDGAGLTYWSDKVRKLNGHGIDLWVRNADGELVVNPQGFKVYDHIENKWHAITLENLAEGYKLAKTANQKHCFQYDLDIDDYDACFGDMVIQYAIFGKLVYG